MHPSGSHGPLRNSVKKLTHVHHPARSRKWNGGHATCLQQEEGPTVNATAKGSLEDEAEERDQEQE